MNVMIKAVALAAAMFASSAQATYLYSDASFGADKKVITFSEVALASGTKVTNQFQGVTFATGGTAGGLYMGSGAYANSNPVSGNYVDSFSGGAAASFYDIIFSSDVTAAGAFWEFNSNTSARFTALNSGVALASFVYNNAACCNSAEFLGFHGLTFDTIRVSNITGVDFYMDKVTFAPLAAAVPEPTGIALFGIAGLGLAYARRRKAGKAA